MAYNLESLIKIIEQVLHPDHHRRRWTLDPNKKPEIESLLKKVRALKHLFGNSSPLTREKTENMESRIRDAAYEAEDILESHLVARIRSVGEGVSFTFSPASLHKVIEEFDSAEEEMKKMMDGSHIPEGSSSPAAAVSSRIDPNPKKILVGLSQDSIQLKDRLTRQEAKLVIIPIVGMGGIGKTTLARNVYDDPLIVSHFDTRAWVTISQEYNIRVILLGLLECIIGKLTNEMVRKENVQLAVHLHQSLCGRRYLIGLDDIWDDKAWDEMRGFFPDHENGSRLIVTTRELNVANYARLNSSNHQMHLLKEDDSWDLLRQKVFLQGSCSHGLEEVGKKIAYNCRGLPLAIHAIGGVLSQVKRTHESWMQVAKDASSVVTDNDEQFSRILSLSYNHLPSHLKPCFLYMSAYPEDHEIRPSKLIRLWVAEGFLEPVSGKRLEEAATTYLEALVDRNLIFVREQETSEIVKSYGIHDLLRELCVRKAYEEKFLYVMNGQARDFPRDRLSLRRVSVDLFHQIGEGVYCARETDYDSMESVPFARSILFTCSASGVIRSPVISALLFLRVLDVVGIDFDEFPEEMLQLLNLRHLAFACRSSLPSSVSTLSNLQTIIFRGRLIHGSLQVTHEMFGLSCLGHVKFLEAHPYCVLLDGESFALQENLQTLCGIAVHHGFNRIIESIPNLKKLGIFCFFPVDSEIDLTCLCKLETLKCSSDLSPEAKSVSSFLIFPPFLKKLTLHRCLVAPAYMNKINSLPNLELLKLRSCAPKRSTWAPTEGAFCRLQFLLLQNVSLVKWEADETHFPRLVRLVIRGCSRLKEISSGIGEIPTLEIIEVHGCNFSVVASARKIHEEQLELGNHGLQVLITGSSSQ